MKLQGTSRWALSLTTSIATVGVAVAILGPLRVPGYDTSYSLAWGRDLASGLGLDFTHPSSPTPHPLALVGGVAAGLLPVPGAFHVVTGFSAAMLLSIVVLVGCVTRELTESRIAIAAAVTTTSISAALWLLALNGASDLTFAALGLGAVFLTLRNRRVAAIVVFGIAALLRPEAVLLMLVPFTLAHRARGTKARSIPETWAFVVGSVTAAGAWLFMGAAGGNPLVAFTSAAANADANANRQGLGSAVVTTLPGLASVAGWFAVIAAGVVVGFAVFTSSRVNRTKGPVAVDTRAVLVASRFIGVAVLAYVGQGLLGTPLVARYLLLPALLCVPIAAACVPLARRAIGSPRANRPIEVIAALALVASSVIANAAGWSAVTTAQHARSVAFAAGSEILNTQLARECAAPFVVRSPAVVALAALSLERPLSDISVASEPANGVLLQPLTIDAAELAGYGPITPIDVQAQFPQSAPPRASNDHWALYSSCVP